MNLDQQLHAHQPQPRSGEDLLEGDTSGAAPDSHLARSSSPDILSGSSDLNLDAGDEQSVKDLYKNPLNHTEGFTVQNQIILGG
jgi:hypothetical protein